MPPLTGGTVFRDSGVVTSILHPAGRSKAVSFNEDPEFSLPSGGDGVPGRLGKRRKPNRQGQPRRNQAMR
eukprot:5105173-Lingulodinium_polyedra.AAC.1